MALDHGKDHGCWGNYHALTICAVIFCLVYRRRSVYLILFSSSKVHSVMGKQGGLLDIPTYLGIYHDRALVEPNIIF